MDDTPSITIRLVTSAKEVAQENWDRLANPQSDPSDTFDYNPFLSHAFFTAVEESGSACRETGWLPQHLVMEQAGEVTGIIPCYLKNHSQGEYVFDHGWADAFERAGGAYYPKLQASVPFTPATGRRLLVGNGPDAHKRRLLLAGGLQQACEQLEVSSAHITFMPEDEWRVLGEHGFLRRNDQQFHWLNEDYETFDDFLAALSSRKRKNIKKERKGALADNGITIEWLTGDQLTGEVWNTFFQFYMDTGSRKWGQPYLTRDFYTRIGETMADDIVLVMAKRDGRYVAGAINFIGSHTLFGRHWGCIEDHPFLHFEICYYQAIEFAIKNKLKRVEAGAQGGHKLARGYMPQMTHSAHFITHPDFRRAVEDYLDRERRAVAMENEAIARHGPFKKENSNDGL
ncbi:MAG: GNAT family N-acetyltransferase [Hyphomicrobiales bacterium]|nr:GNAT family N-acetyltransferase [Hyphomicrobiales bacterium]